MTQVVCGETHYENLFVVLILEKRIAESSSTSLYRISQTTLGIVQIFESFIQTNAYSS